MKKFWKGGSVILGEYENDEGKFGTDTNIFKPITARIMKSKHDGLFYEGLYVNSNNSVFMVGWIYEGR